MQWGLLRETTALEDQNPGFYSQLDSDVLRHNAAIIELF